MAKVLEFLMALVMGAFGFVMLILISLSDRIQKRKSVPAPEAYAGPSASEPVAQELPFPGPVIVHLAVSDRLAARDQATPEELEGLKRAMKKLREQWGDQVMAEELIQETEREWEKRK